MKNLNYFDYELYMFLDIVMALSYIWNGHRWYDL